MEKTRIRKSTTLFAKRDRTAASCISSTHGTFQSELCILSSVLTDQIPAIIHSNIASAAHDLAIKPDGKSSSLPNAGWLNFTHISVARHIYMVIYVRNLTVAVSSSDSQING